MNIWVMVGMHEGEHFASSHFTQKGALIAGVLDMMDFLGIADQESAQSIFNDRLHPTEEEYTEGHLETDFGKMKGMPLSRLQCLFRDYAELAWDNDYGYALEVVRTQVAA